MPRVRRILKETRPDVAVGGGGFASGPVVAVAARERRPRRWRSRPTPTSASPTGCCGRSSSAFCLSFPIEGLEPPRYVVTGRPLAPGQLDATPEQGREVFELRADLPVVLAFGGSQGAQSINRACVDAFGGKELAFQLVHVCGPRNAEQVRARARGARGAV